MASQVRNVFITGCNRGIGLELVKQFLKLQEKPENLFVTCRDSSRAEELLNIAKENANVHVLNLDVTDHTAYDKVVKSVHDKVGDDGLNLLINNAGVLPNERAASKAMASGSGELTPDMMREAFEVNCVAPLFLTKAFLPLLEQAAAKRSSNPVGVGRAAVIMMSTAVASIADNSGGGNYAYRCSKVALNMAMKNFSIDLRDKGVLVMSMHPGWVRTDMGGPNGLIDTETCASTMIKTLQGLTDKDHGTFLRYNNTSIPW